MHRILALTLLLLGFLAAPALAGDGLAGADWVLQGETGERGPFLRFENGSVSGLGGCNRFGGKYKLDGDRLSFSPLMSTRMACRPDLMKKEQAFFDMLGKVQEAKLGDGTLELLDGEGKVLAIFTKRAAD